MSFVNSEIIQAQTQKMKVTRNLPAKYWTWRQVRERSVTVMGIRLNQVISACPSASGARYAGEVFALMATGSFGQRKSKSLAYSR